MRRHVEAATEDLVGADGPKLVRTHVTIPSFLDVHEVGPSGRMALAQLARAVVVRLADDDLAVHAGVVVRPSLLDGLSASDQVGWWVVVWVVVVERALLCPVRGPVGSASEVGPCLEFPDLFSGGGGAYGRVTHRLAGHTNDECGIGGVLAVGLIRQGRVEDRDAVQLGDFRPRAPPRRAFAHGVQVCRIVRTPVRIGAREVVEIGHMEAHALGEFVFPIRLGRTDPSTIWLVVGIRGGFEVEIREIPVTSTCLPDISEECVSAGVRHGER